MRSRASAINTVKLLLILSLSAACSPAHSNSDERARQRYGDAQYLYAGAMCQTTDAKYVSLKNAQFVEGIHRVALEDPSGDFSASDVYLDDAAAPQEAERIKVFSATTEEPVRANVAGWWKDCGGGNIVFLVDKLQVLK